MTDEWRVSNGLRLLHFQSSLSEAYLLDFFVENHWEKRLPKCWRSVIDRMPLAVLSNFISVDNDLKQTGSCYPLSLLAFRQCCRQFSLSQKNTEDLNVIQKFVDSAAKYVMPTCVLIKSL